MSKVIINFKIDCDVKNAVQKMAEELGIPLSSIINAQLRELLRTRTLTISTIPRMTPYLERIIEHVERDRAARRNITKTNSLKGAFGHLDKL